MENRLDEAASPYLQQHADNPVAWQPWDEEARELARKRDVPIFLSIGYAACHWCHVMADESFSDPDIAEKLNQDFVPIKVDREERPDVDSVYMTVCQLVTGSGGWPLSVWLTPEGKPFQVGTYYPPEPKQGMPGFGQVLDDIATSWKDPEGRQSLEDRAEQWTDAVEGRLEETPDQPGDPPDSEFIDAAASTAAQNADRVHGGWGRGQKFPQPGRVHILLRAYDRTGNEEYRDVAVETLDEMASGGLYDHVGGGFHRYCVDRKWTVPHFEKMLYDNAELPRAFLAGYQLTGDERYAEVTRETFAFVERELTHPEGGFYSTLDAESEDESGDREEGAFYVWTPEAAQEAVDDERDAELFCGRYGVHEGGNFEEGQTVLNESATPHELAAKYDMAVDDVEDRIERAKRQVFEAREERSRPPRDEKILAGWNGLMISAFAEGAVTLDPEYAAAAEEAVDFCREQLWDADERRLNRRFKSGDVGIEGYLEDYAFLGRGALDTYQATGEREYLAFALELGRVIRDSFYDEDEATLYFTPTGGESLVARPQELTDTSTPSSAGVAAQLLVALDHVAPDESFAAVAESVIQTHASKIESSPLAHAALVLAADDSAVGALELTIAADGLPNDWRDELASTYLPTRFISVRPPTADGVEAWADELGFDSVPPIWANREARDDRPTVYACRNFTCSPPKHDLAEALAWAASGL
ncbi:thioredoxin domain-containing protein [Natronomonas sp.]|uniref:thioredoxin domain-containing protein n=1 Tax=Natronomonas sp. TaxID=2184060 RepID=UPI002FC324F3